jgi:hypothetical protein
MNKEQSLLLTIRYHLSALGYSEQEIDQQEIAILHFAKLLFKSIPERQPDPVVIAPVQNNDKYEYYMHINDPNFSEWEHDALMSTFDGEWDMAVESRDLDTCNKIIQEVATFCKTHRVPSGVFDFLQDIPPMLVTLNWKEIQNYCPYIVDAYCDEDESEYVDGITGR